MLCLFIVYLRYNLKKIFNKKKGCETQPLLNYSILKINQSIRTANHRRQMRLFLLCLQLHALANGLDKKLPVLLLLQKC